MQDSETTPALHATVLFDERFRQLLRPIEPALEKLLMLDRLGQAFESAILSEGGESMFDSLLAQLGICCHVEPEDLSRIPAEGPAVLVANHPFGFLEGVILGSVLPRRRPDVKFLANSMLAAIPQLRDRCIFVNPFGGRKSTRENRKPLCEGIEWLRGGAVLVVFPAGEVAHLDWRERAVTDPPWSPTVARLIRRVGCPAVPMFFKGSNSISFQLMGAVHAGIRTVNLPRELLNKRGKSIELRIGRRVPAEALRALPSDEAAIEYLRCRTYLLVSRGQPADKPWGVPLLRAPHGKSAAQVTAATASELLEAEIQQLRPDQKMCESDEMSVYLAGAEEVPHIVREIGRLREVTFRQAGEGTGREVDLDRFDASYAHLFIWHKQNQELVGAYRIGATPDILPGQGIRGLYTSTLFHYNPELFRRIGPAIELGRSFVRPEYQRQYAPLLLLWKGICQYVTRRPDCAVLFGAVSISNDYNPVSQDLLVSFLQKHRPNDLARLVRPRRPYHNSRFSRWHTAWLCRLLEDFEGLSDPISDLEKDGKSAPILIRQYMKLGGRILGFNVDSGFSNALDGLILVDLRDAPTAALGRYMSREGASAFLKYHQRLCA